MFAAIPIQYLLILSALLFCIGFAGVMIRRNAIVVFMCIELMLNAVNLTLIAFSHHHQNEEGLLFSFFIIGLAAAEAVVGLAIIVLMFKQKNTVQMGQFSSLRS